MLRIKNGSGRWKKRVNISRIDSHFDLIVKLQIEGH